MTQRLLRGFQKVPALQIDSATATKSEQRMARNPIVLLIYYYRRIIKLFYHPLPWTVGSADGLTVVKSIIHIMLIIIKMRQLLRAQKVCSSFSISVKERIRQER